MAQDKRWKIVANLGDRDFVEHGGTVVLEDKDGEYEPEAEHFDSDSMEVWRYPLERFKKHNGYLVPYGFDETYPHPAVRYRPWFLGSIPDMAEAFDVSEDELVELLTSEKPVDRAVAYDIIGGYHGFQNLDQYPQKLTKKEAKSRFKKA